MIVTVTLNAAIDRTLTVPNFQLGQRHRASQGLTLAGGKGINVARALKRLDIPVVATGLAGGRTGTRIVEELTSEAIPPGWNSLRASHVVGGYRRYAIAKAAAARSDARCLRARKNTGSAPVAIAIDCATSSMSGLGQSRQSGANSASTGSTCAPRRST